MDIQFIFTANPEDYTSRGTIVTPLKVRIESQILTHYPKDIKTAEQITQQESQINEQQKSIVRRGFWYVNYIWNDGRME